MSTPEGRRFSGSSRQAAGVFEQSFVAGPDGHGLQRGPPLRRSRPPRETPGRGARSLPEGAGRARRDARRKSHSARPQRPSETRTREKTNDDPRSQRTPPPQLPAAGAGRRPRRRRCRSRSPAAERGRPARAPAAWPAAHRPTAPDHPATPSPRPLRSREADVEFKLPDGVKPDDKLVAAFKPLAKELGLKGEGAQKLVDLYASTMKRTTRPSRPHSGSAQSAGRTRSRRTPNWAARTSTPPRSTSARFFNVLDKDGSIRKAISQARPRQPPRPRAPGRPCRESFLEDAGAGGQRARRRRRSERAGDARARYPSMFKQA
jgi:hypothetical protein